MTSAISLVTTTAMPCQQLGSEFGVHHQFQHQWVIV